MPPMPPMPLPPLPPDPVRDHPCVPLPTSVGHLPTPGERWAFDDTVTEVFDDMLRRSIPGYETMRATVDALAERYRRDGTAVLDLGTSRGEGVTNLVRRHSRTTRFVLAESAPAMLRAARDRFTPYVRDGSVDVVECDLARDPVPLCDASVALSVLTLQFVPVEHRQRITREVYDRLREGGAFILVEKTLGTGADGTALLRDLYHAHKRQAGYSPVEIAAKALALEHALVPLTAAANEDLLRQAGFRSVEPVWRCLSFAAWVAVK